MTEQRYNAVLAAIGDCRTVSEVATDWGVSGRTMHAWLAWYEAEGLEGLNNRSIWPARVPASRLPARRAGLAFERSLDLGRDPATVEPARLRLHARAVNTAFVHAPGVKRDVIRDRLEDAPRGLAQFAKQVVPGTLRIIAATGDERNALIMYEVRTEGGPFGPRLFPSAQTWMLDDSGKIKVERIVSIVIPLTPA